MCERESVCVCVSVFTYLCVLPHTLHSYVHMYNTLLFVKAVADIAEGISELGSDVASRARELAGKQGMVNLSECLDVYRRCT